MKIRILLAAILVAILGLMLINKADARETVLPPTPELKEPKNINDIYDLPYEFAKNLPDELWYWWAKHHNSLSYDLAALSRRMVAAGETPPVNVTTSTTEIRAQIPASRYWYGDRGGDVNSRADTRTESRVFRARHGGLPAVIYNPYCR